MERKGFSCLGKEVGSKGVCIVRCSIVQLVGEVMKPLSLLWVCLHVQSLVHCVLSVVIR